MTTPILEARDLSKLFPGPKKLFAPARFVTAVDRVSLSVMPGETLAIVACWPPARGACFIRGRRLPTPRAPV